MRRPKLASIQTSLVQDNIPAPLECCEKLGITHIVNASGLPPTYPRIFTYLSVDVRDKNYAPFLGCIPAANIFIEAGLDEGGGVLVHCAGGRSRSAAIIAAFLMSTMNMSFDEAQAECLKARDLVNVNPGFQLQLHAYGAAHCDVHSAHQILIHKRLERFGEKIQLKSIRESSESKEDESDMSKFQLKVEALLSLLDSASNAIQPRLRLSRPASPAVQVIPPLRALERLLSCRRCAAPLFSYANVVLLNTMESHTSFDHKAWAKDYVNKTSKGPQPFLASPNPGGGMMIQDSVEDVDVGMDSHDGHRSGGGRDGPATFGHRGGIGGFSRAEAKEEPSHVTSPNLSETSSSQDALSPKDTDDDGMNDIDKGSPASPPVIPALNFSCGNRYDIRRNSLALQQQHQKIITPEGTPSKPAVSDSQGEEAKGVPVTRRSFTAPHLTLLSSAASELEETGDQSGQSSARSFGDGSNWSTPPDSGRTPRTPRSQGNFRPQSAEKRRWLRRLQVLEQHPGMIKVSPRLNDSPTNDGGKGSSNPRLSDRVQRLAVADEECQKALHSQVLVQPWRAIQKQYRVAVEELSLPESPLRVTSPVDDGGRKSMLDEADEEFVSGVGSAGHADSLLHAPKAFFLEPMAWMDLDAVLEGGNSEGCLSCPGCHNEIGSWMWDKPTSESRVPIAKFAVMRRYVLANPLPSENPSSRDSTPRDSGSIDGGSYTPRERTFSEPSVAESPRMGLLSEPKDGISPRARKLETESKKACDDD